MTPAGESRSLEVVSASISSSTQWSTVLSCPNGDDDGYNSQLPGFESKFSQQHRDDEENRVNNKAWGTDRKRAFPNAAAPTGLHIDITSEQSLEDDSSSCSSYDTSSGPMIPRAAWPLALSPADQRQCQTRNCSDCCTPSPRPTSNMFAEEDDTGDSEGSHRQNLQTWMDQREAQLMEKGNKSGPAGALSQALPPPAFMLLGLLK